MLTGIEVESDDERRCSTRIATYTSPRKMIVDHEHLVPAAVVRRSTAKRLLYSCATASIDTTPHGPRFVACCGRGVRNGWTVRLMTRVAQVARHLCVVLAADVAGYSRLMCHDEEGTLAQLVAARRRMDHLVAAHHGRVVNSVGDSVLAEFSSVIDAIQAAIGIQRELDAAVASTAPDRRVLFRSTCA